MPPGDVSCCRMTLCLITAHTAGWALIPRTAQSKGVRPPRGHRTGFRRGRTTISRSTVWPRTARRSTVRSSPGTTSAWPRRPRRTAGSPPGTTRPTPIARWPRPAIGRRPLRTARRVDRLPPPLAARRQHGPDLPHRAPRKCPRTHQRSEHTGRLIPYSTTRDAITTRARAEQQAAS